jgi:hypothetical protein
MARVIPDEDVSCPDFRPAVRPGRYRHFKGNEYEVVGVATHSENGRDYVIYRPTDSKYPRLWARPIRSFCDELVIRGERVRRFERIESADKPS